MDVKGIKNCTYRSWPNKIKQKKILVDIYKNSMEYIVFKCKNTNTWTNLHTTSKCATNWNNSSKKIVKLHKKEMACACLLPSCARINLKLYSPCSVEFIFIKLYILPPLICHLCPYFPPSPLHISNDSRVNISLALVSKELERECSIDDIQYIDLLSTYNLDESSKRPIIRVYF